MSVRERDRLCKHSPFCALCRRWAVNQSAEQPALNFFGSPIGIRTYNPLYSCCNRQVAGIQISTVVAPRHCGIRTCVLRQGVSG